MQCGIVLPYGQARVVMEMAALAEAHDWDGFFVWEPVWGIDAWVSLAAAAVGTSKIRLGTLLSPLSRMRPWKVASEYMTLDHLSGGRTILSVGLGAADTGFFDFGETTDMRLRAELMDESLDVITGLFRGPLSHEGRHYHIKPTEFLPPPPPLQQTIWVVGLLGSHKSMSRAARYQGLLPSVRGKDGKGRKMVPKDVEATRRFVSDAGCGDDFDIIVEGRTPGSNPAKAAAELAPWQSAGATWWIESMWDLQGKPDLEALMIKRIKQGPPGRNTATTSRPRA